MRSYMSGTAGAHRSWRWLFLALGFAVATACGGMGEPQAVCGSPGTDTDMSQDPDLAPYVRGWTTVAGCDVRRDVIAMREGGGCYPDSIRELLMGEVLGQPWSGRDGTRIYTRDPDGSANEAFATAALLVDIQMPEDAQDSGYRYGDLELWTIPGDQQYVYIVSSDTVEGWPLGRIPYGCL